MIITKNIKKAAKIAQEGSVIAYPTESVFGLGCHPDNQQAIQQLLALKKRPVEKGLILLAANFDQLSLYIAPLSKPLKRKLLASRSKAITWIVPAKKELSDYLTGGRNSLAVRITNYPICIALCQQLDSAIISTSANQTGCLAAKTTDEVREQFPQGLPLVLDLLVQGKKNPSEIRDILSSKVLRLG